MGVSGFHVLAMVMSIDCNPISVQGHRPQSYTLGVTMPLTVKAE